MGDFMWIVAEITRAIQALTDLIRAATELTWALRRLVTSVVAFALTVQALRHLF